MKKFYFFATLLFSITTLYAQVDKKAIREVQDLIKRTVKNQEISVTFKSISKQNGCDVFYQEVNKGKLTIKGSSGVALSKGFYDFIRNNQYGIVSWTGNRFQLPTSFEESYTHGVTSPFKHHYYFNVVTYGYTMPYWDWNRWEKEIDWMALHGVDMPLALVANEAISARVWKKLGLTEKEISDYFVGPAHLPWMRMGNISQIDGPLPKEWHQNQIQLQHRILKRMKGLGMKPICPGFAGFVPKAMKRIFPDIQIVETSWGGAFHNWMLSPEEKLFHKIGKMFIQEWEKEFGKNDYYIVDSFNELEIPFPPKNDPKRYSLLASYGDAVYKSIKDGNKDATWVMQGWMFGYQRDIWDYKTLEALLSKVPDSKMLLLDLAVDYNKCFWNSEVNWDFYKGFYNKPWVYSVIPNMGGKSGMTGILSFYANGHLEALNSTNKGKLVGFGMAPEGIENNEVIYELLSDAGWSNKEIDINSWLANYSKCRYGSYSTELKSFWNEMQQSVYGSFTDHPRYNWQLRPGMTKRGTINANEHFYKGIETLCEIAPQMKSNELFKADFSEWTVAYIGGKLEILTQNIDDAYLYNELEKAKTLEAQFVRLMLSADALLAKHPVKDMNRWIGFARKQGNTKSLSDYYERNARRIVTIWGPPVDDYSARIWSGLIRDYYLPRWTHYFEQKKNEQRFNFAEWERNWVENATGLSDVKVPTDVINYAIELINEAKSIALSTVNKEEMVGSWTNTEVTDSWSELQWNVSADKVKQIKAIKVHPLKNDTPITISSISLIMDGHTYIIEGNEISIATTRALKVTIPSSATGNNSCILKVILKKTKGTNSSGKVELVF